MLSKFRQLRAGLQWLLTRSGPLSVPAGAGGALYPRAARLPHAGSAVPVSDIQRRLLRGRAVQNSPDLQISFARSGRTAAARFACGQRIPRTRRNCFRTTSARKPTASSRSKASSLPGAWPRRGRCRTTSSRASAGSETASDEDIEAYLVENGGCVSHQVGTCKMGTDKNGGGRSGLRVHGVDNLRVVDASIMPTLISGNTNAPTIMIAEKAAAEIRSS